MSATSLDPMRLETLLREEAQAQSIDLGLAQAVMTLRRRHARDGNRRRLYAAIDDLLSGGRSDAQAGLIASGGAVGPVRLVSLQLRNWRVFEQLDLRLPVFEVGRPVVLIGGKNGYGKTSLLEGLQYGLFGRTAVVDLSRIDSAMGAGAYRQTMQRAFNRRARDRGEEMASVRSEWATPEGPLVVERRWFFDADGAFAADDETLTLWTGDDASLVACPEGVEPREYLQEEIHRRLLSPSLAAFVFFDGEQVQRFAEAGFSEQVQSALENASGLSLWRAAASDLRDYARDRLRTGAKPDVRDETAASVARLRAEADPLRDILAALAQRREGPTTARDKLLTEIGSLETGDYAGLHVLLERQQANRAERARAGHEFAAVAAQVLPGVLTAALGQRLATSLAKEMAPEQAEATFFQNETALEQLVEAIRRDEPMPTGVEAHVRRAWARLQSTAGRPAVARRHGYLPFRLLATLSDAAKREPDAAQLQATAERVRTLDAEAQSLSEALAHQKRRDDRLGAARRELQGVRHELGLIDAEVRLVESRLAQLDEQLRSLAPAANTDLGDAGDETTTRARAALAVATELDSLIAGVTPRCFATVGAAITESYLSLAHKGLVAEIRIGDDGAVRLLDGRGADVPALDASAGESQVFAMSLIGAIGALAGHRLPVIIDTPLGRLDPDHRMRILAYFSSRERQTLLLSQPDEVNGAYLAMIEDRIAARFHLEHASPDGGPGGSTAAPGYFEELAA